MHTEEQIDKAVFRVKSLFYSVKIVRYYDGFIILAQNEEDYKAKMQQIKRGDTKGFYTVEFVLSGSF
jgi:hypothetical protein